MDQISPFKRLAGNLDEDLNLESHAGDADELLCLNLIFLLAGWKTNAYLWTEGFCLRDPQQGE